MLQCGLAVPLTKWLGTDLGGHDSRNGMEDEERNNEA